MRPLPRKCGVCDNRPRAPRRRASEKRLCIANPGLYQPRTTRDCTAEVAPCADVATAPQRFADRVVAARFAACAAIAHDAHGGSLPYELVITLAVHPRAHCRE